MQGLKMAGKLMEDSKPLQEQLMKGVQDLAQMAEGA